MAKEDLLKDIEERLDNIGVDIDDIPAALIAYLEKIEIEVSKRFDAESEAIEAIKNNAININTISKSGIISNKTIYKHDILESYVKHCEAEYKKKLPGDKDKITALRERLEEAENTVHLFDLHSVDNEVLKHELDELRNEIRDLNLKIQILSQENAKLRTNASDDEEEIDELQGKIIDFNTGKEHNKYT